MNPGPPAPQAGVIIRQHGKFPVILDLSIVLDDEPILLRPKFRGRIVNTLLKLKYYTKNHHTRVLFNPILLMLTLAREVLKH